MKLTMMAMFCLLVLFQLSFAKADYIALDYDYVNDTQLSKVVLTVTDPNGDTYSVVVNKNETDLSLNGGGNLTGTQKNAIKTLLRQKVQDHDTAVAAARQVNANAQAAHNEKTNKIDLNVNSNDLW